MDYSSSKLYDIKTKIEKLNYVKESYDNKIFHIIGFGGERVLILRNDEMIGLIDLDHYSEILINVGNLDEEEIKFLLESIKDLENEYIELNKKLDEEIEKIRNSFKESITAKILFLMGIINEFDDEFNNAREMYIKALSKDSSLTQANFNLGKIEFTFNELEISRGHLEKAIKGDLSPEKKREALTFLGLIEIANENQDSAKKYFEDACKEFPTDPDSFYNLGNFLFKQKEYGDSLDNLKKAIELYGDNMTALGRIRDTVLLAADMQLNINNNPHDSVKILESHLKINPMALQSDKRYEKLLVEAYRNCGEKLKAVWVKDRTIKISMPSASRKKFLKKIDAKNRFNTLFYILFVVGTIIAVKYFYKFLTK